MRARSFPLMALGLFACSACSEGESLAVTDGGALQGTQDGGSDATREPADAAGCVDATYFPDCDGDGFASLDASGIMSCGTPEDPPSLCEAGSWTTTLPATNADCDDSNGGASAMSTFFTDCDGDGWASRGAESIVTCGLPSARPDDCAPQEAAGWTMREPSEEARDCDDHVETNRAPLVWYADCDGDGYAASGAVSFVSCDEPAAVPAPCKGGGAWTERPAVDEAFAPTNTSTDCLDSNIDVFPEQENWFAEAITGSDPARAFDYDCDGVVERRWTELYTCSVSSSEPLCVWAGIEGWLEAVPSCGEEGLLGNGCELSSDNSFCSPSSGTASSQGCH